MLVAAGVGVLSEESGRHHPERAVTVVVDPLDGSTNASRGIPWFATSLCAVDADGPLAALVVDLVHGTRYEAVRGGGARRDGEPITPSEVTRARRRDRRRERPARTTTSGGRSSGRSARPRSTCARWPTAGSTGSSTAPPTASRPWDYLGGLLVCREAGATVRELSGRELVVTDHGARRLVVAGATAGLTADAGRGEDRLGTVVKRP